MWLDTACQALRLGKRLELRYDGFSRVVEVHAAGWTKDNNAIMRVWQVYGGSQSGERTGWKLMRLDEAFSARLTDENSEAPRDGYKRGGQSDPHHQVPDLTRRSRNRLRVRRARCLLRSQKGASRTAVPSPAIGSNMGAPEC